ncbi:hypothetical protein NEPAR06_0936 [Nematocida parisii]|uniref:Sas10 C-terminal domain-containing protein n=1 Tax=Nematocida parisii (strain ERTm3) TaxID=935791 RepID=I3EDQ8_NEMP3|nr:hypothetical protein NEQG_02478 [Nematocida parisii ERTm3]KAI5127585.1 hypothetical protein NEPAR08_0955 [Nematocida parisii]KAI5127860.1 hypothetical protein NEPAR03_1140 [Nematocida parisii]KAI5141624.1 hypothetical protein NEPAR04_1101 [Nematocida parisii]KAI5145625.1 hypothetical protein NEPAR07_1825 [Nematocida parisii]
MTVETEKYKELKFQNVDEVKAVLKQLNPEESSLKESLLRCYILNLIMYNQLEETHPIKKTLITLSVYIDLVDKASKAEQPAGSNIIKEAEEELMPEGPETHRRPIDFTIQKNRVHTEKQGGVKPEQRNPRIKNKRRYQDAHNLAGQIRKEYPKLHKK